MYVVTFWFEKKNVGQKRQKSGVRRKKTGRRVLQCSFGKPRDSLFGNLVADGEQHRKATRRSSCIGPRLNPFGVCV